MTGIARNDFANRSQFRPETRFGGDVAESWNQLANVRQFPALPQTPVAFKEKVLSVAVKPTIYQPTYQPIMHKDAPVETYVAADHAPKTIDVFGRSFNLPELPKFDMKLPTKFSFGTGRPQDHNEAAA